MFTRTKDIAFISTLWTKNAVYDNVPILKLWHCWTIFVDVVVQFYPWLEYYFPFSLGKVTYNTNDDFQTREEQIDLRITLTTTLTIIWRVTSILTIRQAIYSVHKM